VSAAASALHSSHAAPRRSVLAAAVSAVESASRGPNRAAASARDDLRAVLLLSSCSQWDAPKVIRVSHPKGTLSPKGFTGYFTG